LRLVVREQVNAWARAFPQDELMVVTRQSDADVVRREVPDRVRVVGTRAAPQASAATASLPWIARRHGAETYLSHNFAGVDGRGGVFVHDFLFERHPEWFTRPERAYFSLMPLLSRFARPMFVSTDTERLEIQRVHPGLPRPIVAPLAPSATDLSVPPVDPRLPIKAGSYLLTVGRLNIRKNLARTMEAVLRSNTVSSSFPLVVAGEPDGKGANMTAALEESTRDGRVIFTGSLPQAKLNWLYKNSSAFLFLSLGEGFGLTPLESLTLSPAPVLVSDLPIFHETLGSRARFVDPTDVEAIAGAVTSLPLNDGSRTWTPELGAALDGTWDRHVTVLRENLAAARDGGGPDAGGI
jgi:glycosyltransferase involved in cell wall biosynthesis